MLLPPGFNQQIAIEAADLVLQAYQQYVAFISEKPWALIGNYQILAMLESRPTELSIGKEPFGFVVLNLVSGNVFVTFRGTQSFLDWIADFTVPQVAHPWGAVERGNDFIYSQCSDSVKGGVRRAPAGAAIFTTGHSLGGALAVLATADLVMAGVAARMYSFAGPRAGDPAFAAKFNQLVSAAWRVANTEDLVPTLPLATTLLGAPSTIQLSALRLMLARLDKLEYAHVGEAVCFSAQHGSIGANHDMQLYRETVNAAKGIAIPALGTA